MLPLFMNMPHRPVVIVSAFPGLKNIVLMKVVPERIDVVNYKHGFNGDPVTWGAPSIALPGRQR